MEHMKLMKLIGVLAVSAVLLSGCAGAPTALQQGGYPAWYLNPGQVFPDSRYLTAVGTGVDRAQAEQQALAGLSQIFEAQVTVDMVMQERYADIVSASGRYSEEELELTQTTQVSSVQNLLNVQFGEAAVDSRGMIHIIGYIEREQTGRVYADLIERNSNQVRSLLREADFSRDPVDRFAYLSAASVVAQGNDMLVNQLRIISPAQAGRLHLGYDLVQILQLRSQQAEKLRVEIVLEEDHDNRVAGMIGQAFGREGFSVSSEQPLLRVTGNVDVSESSVTGNFETVRWTLVIRMDLADGTGIAHLDEQGRASGISSEAARSLAYRDIKQVIDRQLAGQLQGWMDYRILGK